jgi:opacity protein-like surface antigen
MPNRRVSTAFVLVAMTLLTLMDVATLSKAQADEDRSNWYGLLGMGMYREDSNPSIGEMGLDVSTNNTVVRGYLGYNLFKYLFFELGYVDFDRIEYRTSSGLKAIVEDDGFHARVLGALPINRQSPEEFLSVYGTVGAYQHSSTVKVDAGGTNVDSFDSEKEVDMTVGAGFQYSFKSGGARLEFERYRFQDKDSDDYTDFNVYSLNFFVYF